MEDNNQLSEAGEMREDCPDAVGACLEDVVLVVLEQGACIAMSNSDPGSAHPWRTPE